MIVFKKVSFKNFLSYGNKMTSVRLDTDESVLVIAENADTGKEGNSSNGSGKCLGKDTPVLMYDGTIKMVQDVQIGDFLMGDDGTPRAVLSLARGREEMFRVRQNLGMDYVVNRSHILSLKAGTTRPKWGHTKGSVVNVTVDDYLKYPEYVKRGVCGYIADLTGLDNGIDVFEPWLIGLWLADGSASKPDITFNNKDQELIEAVDRIAASHGWGKNVTPSSYRRNCTTVSYPGGFLKKLKDIGILNNKHIPKEYLFSSYENRLALLAGILDGDGYCEGRIVDIVLKDNQLPLDVAFLARSVGLRVKISDKFSKCQNFDGAIYKRLSISGDLTKIPNVLSRKRGTGIPKTAKPRQYGVTGITVESLGEGEYYGFEIDGNRLFCLGDMTVTHNTSSMQAIVYALFGTGVNDVKKDELVNFINEKDMLVELEFEVDGAPYLIRRGRKPNITEFWQGETDLTRDSGSNVDAEIESVLGMNYDGFMATHFLTTSVTQFMQKKPAEQRQFMEDFIHLNTLTERAESLKKMRSETQTDKKLVERDIANADDFNANLYKQKQTYEVKAAEFEQTRTQKIDGLVKEKTNLEPVFLAKDEIRTGCTELNQISEEVETTNKTFVQFEGFLRADEYKLSNNRLKIENYENNITRIEGDIDATEQKIAGLSFDETQLKELHTTLNELEEIEGHFSVLKDAKTLNLQLDKDIARMEKTKEEKTSELVHLEDGTCPYCSQSFSDDQSKAKMEQLRKEIAELVVDLEKNTAELTEVVDLIEETEKLVEGFEAGSIKSELKTLRDEINKMESDKAALSQLTETLAALKSSLVEAENTDVSALVEENEKLDESIKFNNQKLDDLKADLKKLEEKATLVRNKYPLDLVRDVFDLDVKLEKYAGIEDAIIQVENDVNPFTSVAEHALDDLKDVDQLKQQYADIEVRETHIGYLIKLLTDSKSFIRKGIVDQYVPYLNKRINERLETFGMNHTARINPDLTVYIEYMGRSVSFHSMSAGEKLRLNMATSLSFRDLLGMIGVKTNLMLVDEIFDSALDESGTKDIFNMVKGYGHLMLISHSDDFNTLVDRTMLIRKKNGFSEIVG